MGAPIIADSWLDPKTSSIDTSLFEILEAIEMRKRPQAEFGGVLFVPGQCMRTPEVYSLFHLRSIALAEHKPEVVRVALLSCQA